MSTGTSLFAITPRSQPPKPGENKKQVGTAVPLQTHFPPPPTTNSSLSNPSLSKYIPPGVMAGAPPSHTSSGASTTQSGSCEVKDRTPSWKISSLWTGGSNSTESVREAKVTTVPDRFTGDSSQSISSETVLLDQKEKEKKEREYSFFELSRTIMSDRFMRCAGFWGFLIVPVVLYFCLSQGIISTISNWCTNTQPYSSWYGGSSLQQPGQSSGLASLNGGSNANGDFNSGGYSNYPFSEHSQGGDQSQNFFPVSNPNNFPSHSQSGWGAGGPADAAGGVGGLWHGANGDNGQLFAQAQSQQNAWNYNPSGGGVGTWKGTECNGVRSVFDEERQKCICPIRVCGPGCDQDQETCACLCGLNLRYEDPPLVLTDSTTEDFPSEKDFMKLSGLPNRHRPITGSNFYMPVIFASLFKMVFIPLLMIGLFVLICRCCRSCRGPDDRRRDRRCRSRSRSPSRSRSR